MTASLSGSLTAVSAPAAAASLYAQPRYAAILIDNDTGEVLYARQADTPRAPASITKVMTLYVAFAEIAAGRLREDDRITVSNHAARQEPSKIWLRPGGSISVRDAIGTIATRSANDAAVALAEHISGSEAAFAERMTATARQLGMSQTQFVNASGLSHPRHLTTARDIAILSRAMIRDFPVLYPVFSQVSYSYRGQAIASHNHLLKTMAGVDGIKTGFTQTAGFTLAASAVQNGKRLVAVVLGGPSRMGRDSNVGELLSVGFDVLNRRRMGIETTVAANFAEPDDLPDSVMDRLATLLPSDSAVLAGTLLPPVPIGGGSATMTAGAGSAAMMATGGAMASGSALAAANAMSNAALLTYPPQ